MANVRHKSFCSQAPSHVFCAAKLSKAEKAEYDAISAMFVNAVEQAYNEVMDLTCLKYWAGSQDADEMEEDDELSDQDLEKKENGYIRNFLRVLEAARAAGKHDFRLPMATGYGIEQRAYQIADFMMAKKTVTTKLLKVLKQVTKGSARPDIVVLAEGTTSQIWIDITSSGDEGHVLGKAGAMSRHCEEVIYPSIDFAFLIGKTPGAVDSPENREILEFVISERRRIAAQAERDKGEIVKLFTTCQRHFPTFQKTVQEALPDLTPAQLQGILQYAHFTKGKTWPKSRPASAVHFGPKFMTRYQAARQRRGINKPRTSAAKRRRTGT